MPEKLTNSSLLLLYLADELSIGERARVDQMLASNPAFRAEFNDLDAAVTSFDAEMAHLDAAPIQGESAALMRIGSAIRQRLAGRSATQFLKPAAIARGWRLPAAAAAAVLVACLIWYERPSANNPNIAEKPIAVHPDMTPPVLAEKIADDMAGSFNQGNPTQAPKSVASLEAAEEQIAELSNGGSDPVRSFFAIPDSNE